MFIEICDSLVIPNISNDVVITLDNIATAAREGKHIFYASPKACHAIYSNPVCNGYEKIRQVFKKIEGKYSEYKSVKQHVSIFMRIIPGVNILKKIKEKKYDVIEISIDHLQESSIFQETVLLPENKNDEWVFSQIGNFYSSLHHSPGFKFDPRNGGGNTTSDSYKDIQSSRNRLCLCIVDSDKKFPNDVLGATAQKVKDSDEQGNPLAFYHILELHELENLFSSEQFLEMILGNDTNRKKAADFLNRIDDAKKYFDIKTGFKYKRFYENPDFRKYWEEQSLKIKKSCHEKCKNCSKTHKSCTDTVIHGFGNHFLKDIEEAIVSLNTCDLKEKLCAALYNIWEKLGEMILSWCCCTKVPIAC